MRALELHAIRDVRLAERPDPVPGPGAEIVRVTAVGLCGSDLHWYEDGGIGDARLAAPLVLGHEAGGVIVDGPRAGTRVAIDPADPCERCDVCVAGHANLCASMRFAGHGRTDGALRERMAWPSRLLIPVPSTIADHEVPLLESLGVAIHAAEIGHVRAGMTAGVHGCGPIGLLLIAVLRAMGLRGIVASDPLAHRRQAALVAGAETVGDVDAEGMSAAAEPGTLDVAFEVAGEDGALATALRVVRPGGRVVLVGIPSSDRTAFGAGLARRKGLTLALSRRMKAHHLVRAIGLAGSGVVSLAPLVSATYPLAEGPAAFAALVRRDGLKVVVRPDA